MTAPQKENYGEVNFKMASVYFGILLSFPAVMEEFDMKKATILTPAACAACGKKCNCN